jgi:hypothetical protein
MTLLFESKITILTFLRHLKILIKLHQNFHFLIMSADQNFKEKLLFEENEKLREENELLK